MIASKMSNPKLGFPHLILLEDDDGEFQGEPIAPPGKQSFGIKWRNYERMIHFSQSQTVGDLAWAIESMLGIKTSSQKFFSKGKFFIQVKHRASWEVLLDVFDGRKVTLMGTPEAEKERTSQFIRSLERRKELIGRQRAVALRKLGTHIIRRQENQLQSLDIPFIKALEPPKPKDESNHRRCTRRRPRHDVSPDDLYNTINRLMIRSHFEMELIPEVRCIHPDRTFSKCFVCLQDWTMRWYALAIFHHHVCFKRAKNKHNNRVVCQRFRDNGNTLRLEMESGLQPGKPGLLGHVLVEWCSHIDCDYVISNWPLYDNVACNGNGRPVVLLQHGLRELRDAVRLLWGNYLYFDWRLLRAMKQKYPDHPDLDKTKRGGT